MIKKVEFPSEGAILRGLLFLPEAQAHKPPVIIMAHGTSAGVDGSGQVRLQCRATLFDQA
jgi:dienelactone hydrolase